MNIFRLHISARTRRKETLPAAPRPPTCSCTSLPSHFGTGSSSLLYYYQGGAYLPPPSNNVKFNHVDEHPRPQFFLTIPHFEWGSGCNTVGSKKIHNFARKMKSWSILLHFHKGGPLRTTDPLKKSLFQTMSWGGSRYPKVVNPFVWCQSE